MSRPLEFTAVYEPQPNGTFIGYVAEVPGASVVARSLDEARARLAEKLRQALDGERDAALSRIGLGAQVESIHLEVDARRQTHVEAGAHQETRVDTGRPAHAPELDLLRFLYEQGRIGELPNLGEVDDDNFEPVRVEGKPISQEIIEGRR